MANMATMGEFNKVNVTKLIVTVGYFIVDLEAGQVAVNSRNV